MTATATAPASYGQPNRYAATCDACGSTVAPGTGHLVAKVGGRWTIAHGNRTPQGQPCPGMVEPLDRYAGMSWLEVCEENEHWDGEPEPRAAALRRWEAANPGVAR